VAAETNLDKAVDKMAELEKICLLEEISETAKRLPELREDEASCPKKAERLAKEEPEIDWEKVWWLNYKTFALSH
jgi:hypothetical protein